MSSRGPESKDYYDKGSTQVSEASAVTLKKLAKVSLRPAMQAAVLH